ncbi:MAG: hypothetical protein HUU34_14030 [Saprospiraceae bacterium]|nr:hypothetical protein [Saprospiraceae bacterium]
MKKILFPLCILIFPGLLFQTALNAQEADKEVLQIQPTIMVVPWTSKNEDMRAKVESDFAYRAILNEIRAAFDKQGFTTFDFVEALKINATDRVTGFQNWRDLFKDVIDNSPAELEVLAEIHVQNDKYGKKVDILLATNDKYSGESILSSGLISSDPFNTTDYAVLAQRALAKNNAMTTYLNALQEKFNIIVNSVGRSIAVRIEIKEGCPFTLQTEAGEDGDYVSDLIVDWVKQNAYKNNYKMGGKSASLLDFRYIKIPLRDKDGMNYDINNFSRVMRRAIRKIGEQTEKGDKFQLEELIRGNKLIITILQ